MTPKTLEDAIAQNHSALDSMVKGDCSGYVALLSNNDDVSWGNPFGPFARGRQSVESVLESAAARMQGGAAANPEHIATYTDNNLAVVVQVENVERAGEDGSTVTSSLRVTSVYRLEADGWKLVHRHADPITTAR